MHCCNRRNRTDASSTKVAVNEDKEKICDEWLRDFEKSQEEKVKTQETERAARAEKLRAEEEEKALTVMIKKSAVTENIGIDCDKTLKVVQVNVGLIEEWNNQNPDSQVRIGDRIISVNGVYRSTAEMVQEVGKSLGLTLKFQKAVFVPEAQVSQDSHHVSSSSGSNAQVHTQSAAKSGMGDSSAMPRSEFQRTAPQGYSADALRPVDRGDADDRACAHESMVLNVATDEELSAMHWREHPEDSSMQVVEIQLVKTDEVKSLGVDARKANFALRVSNFTSGLIPIWNENHPDAQIEIGDCIVAVNGVRGSPERMVQAIGQSTHLRLTFQREIGAEVAPDEL